MILCEEEVHPWRRLRMFLPSCGSLSETILNSSQRVSEDEKWGRWVLTAAGCSTWACGATCCWELGSCCWSREESGGTIVFCFLGSVLGGTSSSSSESCRPYLEKWATWRRGRSQLHLRTKNKKPPPGIQQHKTLNNCRCLPQQWSHLKYVRNILKIK